MTIALAANLLTSILCAAVLVQSVRMARRLNTVKDGDLPRMVAALDNATGEARAVLSELKRTLGTDCAQHARQVERAHELRDELELISGIGNAAAERILAAMALANGTEQDAAPAELPDEARNEAAPEAPFEASEAASGETALEAPHERLVEALGKSAAKTSVRTRAKKPAEAPAKTRGKKPEASATTSAKKRTEARSKTSAEAPDEAPTEAGSKTSATKPAETPDDISAETPGEVGGDVVAINAAAVAVAATPEPAAPALAAKAA